MATNNAWNNKVLAANVIFNGGTVNVGSDATDNDINIGTAASAGRAVTIGSTTGTSSLDLRCGTSGIALTSAAGDLIVATSSGEITYPLQPCFLAYPNATLTDVTGGGVSYVVAYDTEAFDQNSDYNTSTYQFTAPLDGRYFFGFSVLFTDVSSTYDDVDLRIETSNATYRNWQLNIGKINVNNSDVGMGFTTLADMDLGDVAYIEVTVFSDGQNVDIYGGSPDRRSVFYGYLVA